MQMNQYVKILIEQKQSFGMCKIMFCTAAKLSCQSIHTTQKPKYSIQGYTSANKPLSAIAHMLFKGFNTTKGNTLGLAIL